LFRRRRDDEALDDEIDLHLSLLEQRFIDRGLTVDEARREARRAFGGVQQLRESHRDGRGFAWLTEIAQDGSYAVRMLRRQPLFTSAAIVTLALGIGANTAVFSVVEAVLLRPLPYPAPDRVERLGWYWNDRGPAIGAMAPYKYQYLRDHARAFEHLAVWQAATRDLGLRGAAGPKSVVRVSNEFFSVVGSQPALGRTFTDAEQQPGAGGRRGSDRRVLGRAIRPRSVGARKDSPARRAASHRRRRHAAGVRLPRAVGAGRRDRAARTDRGPPRSGSELLGDRPRAAGVDRNSLTSGSRSRLRSIAAANVRNCSPTRASAPC
jgi:hypothetical protein